MTGAQDISAAERQLLLMALKAPLLDHDLEILALCLRLCERRLLQRAGGAAIVNGWRGSPHAFVLTREGWRVVREVRRTWPVRQAG
jgi:hypothetical protein